MIARSLHGRSKVSFNCPELALRESPLRFPTPATMQACVIMQRIREPLSRHHFTGSVWRVESTLTFGLCKRFPPPRFMANKWRRRRADGLHLWFNPGCWNVGRHLSKHINSRDMLQIEAYDIFPYFSLKKKTLLCPFWTPNWRWSSNVAVTWHLNATLTRNRHVNTSRWPLRPKQHLNAVLGWPIRSTDISTWHFHCHFWEKSKQWDM